MHRRFIITCISALCLSSAFSQTNEQKDSAKSLHSYLPEINIVGRSGKADIVQMPEIVGTSIFAGKKNALVVMDNLNANVVTNNMRQVLAKVPGIHVWESDGSGIQIGIAARGLSPNRSWEFNVRQNGYDISSDPYGYPEAYYTPQLQAVQRIQVVRGAGSLQYGPQFGGMVNFLLRDGSDINKPFRFETENTVGSFGLINTYNAIGGETKKFNYYAFFDHREANGWRKNSKYYTNTGFANTHYKINDKFKVGVEYMHWNMRSQQPGGLTDKQFTQDAQQSFRSRNWFDVTWQAAALSADYNFKLNNRLTFKLFKVDGTRNSIGFLKAIDVKDTINATTGVYNNRTVDIDKYKNLGAELRYLGDYKFAGISNTIGAGVRYFDGNTDRFKNGVGDVGTDYNVNIIGTYPTDLNLRSKNFAAFAENIMRVNEKLIFIPGIRYEHLETVADGLVSTSANGNTSWIKDEKRTRNFVLLGIGAEYHINETEFYGNYSQAYRPMLFSDLSVAATTEIVDPEMKDADGYNIDLGYRGKVKDYLSFDISVYYLKYNNRIGVITQQRADGTFYNFRTNIGESDSRGIESFIEFNPIKAWVKDFKLGNFSIFISRSFIRARYTDVPVITKSGNNLVVTNLRGNEVENAPSKIIRTGLTWNWGGFSATGQISYVGETFSDANNTVTPSANGQVGLIPSYNVADVSLTYKLKERYSIRAGVNNVGNQKYFTRRAGGYPGPGLMPADARSFYLSVGAKI
jgi:Fe(3+) dicitrate transport protein